MIRKFGKDKLRVAGAVIVLLAGIAMYLLGLKWESHAYGDALVHIGTFVAAAVLVSFLYEWFLREKHDKETVASIEAALTSQSMVVLVNDHDLKLHARIEHELRAWLETHVEKAGVWGLGGFEREFDYKEVFERLDSGDELLWLNNFCPNGFNYRDALVAAVRRGASVKMLVARPDSAASNLRALEIETQDEFSPPYFAEKIREELRILKAAEGRISTNDTHGSFEVRTYADLPGMPMYVYLKSGSCSLGYSSFYLSEPSAVMPHLKWYHVEGGMLEKMYRYYVCKWSANDGADAIYLRLNAKTVL